jgi:hypothetical protein
VTGEISACSADCMTTKGVYPSLTAVVECQFNGLPANNSVCTCFGQPLLGLLPAFANLLVHHVVIVHHGTTVSIVAVDARVISLCVRVRAAPCRGVAGEAAGAGKAPVVTRRCNVYPCRMYYYAVGDYTSCTNDGSCGLGEKSRFRSCVDEDITPVADAACASSVLLPGADPRKRIRSRFVSLYLRLCWCCQSHRLRRTCSTTSVW